MTHIITAVTKDSILMASDTRLNYHEEIEEDGNTYQLIKLTADCIRKTFYLEKANLGIQFIGIGYLLDGTSRYPLSHFLPKLEKKIKRKQGIKLRIKIVLNNLKEITNVGNTGNYVNGVISGIENNTMYICTFNTFNKNNNLDIKEVKCGQFVDSEKIIDKLENNEELIINQINETIENSSKNKPQSIGDEVEILKITKNGALYIKEGKNLFYGDQKELFNLFQTDLSRINGKILNPPIKEKINL